MKRYDKYRILHEWQCHMEFIKRHELNNYTRHETLGDWHMSLLDEFTLVINSILHYLECTIIFITERLFWGNEATQFISLYRIREFHYLWRHNSDYYTVLLHGKTRQLCNKCWFAFLHIPAGWLQENSFRLSRIPYWERMVITRTYFRLCR